MKLMKIIRRNQIDAIIKENKHSRYNICHGGILRVLKALNLNIVIRYNKNVIDLALEWKIYIPSITSVFRVKATI